MRIEDRERGGKGRSGMRMGKGEKNFEKCGIGIVAAQGKKEERKGCRC